VVANESTEPALGGRFNLMRYFTLASAVAMVGVALLSALTFGALMRHALVQEDEADAVALAQHIAEEFNAALDALLQTEVTLRWDVPQVQGYLSEVFTHSSGGLSVIKIKVFDATGQIIYSTDLALIGQLDASNPNLQGALAGQVTSKLVRAEKVADLSGETFTVDVIETYVPVSRQPGSPFQVFEIYQDATDLLAQVQEAQRVLAAAVASIMLLIFLLLYLIVRRADQVIARQTTDLQVANTELRRLEQLSPI
jgi:hypothetical protein